MGFSHTNTLLFGGERFSLSSYKLVILITSRFTDNIPVIGGRTLKLITDLKVEKTHRSCLHKGAWLLWPPFFLILYPHCSISILESREDNLVMGGT